jgi:WD40 repeat protein
MRRRPLLAAVLAAAALAGCSGGGSDGPVAGTARHPVRSTTSTTGTTASSTTTTTPATSVPTSSVPAPVTTVPAPAQAPVAPILFFSSHGGTEVGWYAVSPDGGTPTRLLGVADTEPALAPGRGRFAFGRGSDVIVRPVRGPGTVVARAPQGKVTDVAWSRDGRMLAFATVDGSIPGQVFVVPAAGGPVRQVGTSLVETLAWSPDSKTIAGAGPDGLWMFPVAGAPVRLREQRAFDVAWSSRDVLAVQLDDKNVHVMAPDAAGDHVIGEGIRPQWSPDGSTVAFTGNEGNETGVAVAPGAGGAIRFLTPPSEHGRSPVWSPDGRTLAYASIAGGTSMQLLRIDLDGSHRRLLTTQRDVDSPVW